MRNIIPIRLIALTLLTALAFALPASSYAHCDSMNGPVVLEAQRVLESGDVQPLLKWVNSEDEQEVIDAFNEVRAVRGESPAVKSLADRYFFETVVRLHRASEGVAYTGIKPAETPINAAVLAADAALESGDAEHLVHHLTARLHDALLERFEAAHAALQHADESTEAGREYVRNYVLFTHLAEFVHEATDPQHGHGHETEAHGAAAHAH